MKDVTPSAGVVDSRNPPHLRQEPQFRGLRVRGLGFRGLETQFRGLGFIGQNSEKYRKSWRCISAVNDSTERPGRPEALKLLVPNAFGRLVPSAEQLLLGEISSRLSHLEAFGSRIRGPGGFRVYSGAAGSKAFQLSILDMGAQQHRLELLLFTAAT